MSYLSKFPSFRPKITRNYAATVQTASLWKLFKDKNVKTAEKPSRERCRKRKPACDPDLSHIGGKPFKTCGSAYVVQKDRIPAAPRDVMSEEDMALRKMEADPTLKDAIIDPMPPFRSVEQRLLDLTERKLHPFYKVFMSMPKKDMTEAEVVKDDDVKKCDVYETRSGPIRAEDIPDKLKIKKELLEKKNIFADFKRIQVPRQMVARIVEMERNRKPTMEKKIRKCARADKKT